MDSDSAPTGGMRPSSVPEVENANGWEDEVPESAVPQPESAGTDSSPQMSGPKQCTKILPASSSAPKYKFVVPNEFVSKWMQQLIEQPFRMIDGQGGTWDMVLIQRRNKEKYEYMLQGWRRFGEDMGVQEGDTVVFEMVDMHTMLLNIVQRASGSRIKVLRAKAEAAAIAATHGHLPPHLHGGMTHEALAGQGMPGGMAAPDLLALVQQQQAGYLHQGGPPHAIPGGDRGPMASQLATAPPPGPPPGAPLLAPPRLSPPPDGFRGPGFGNGPSLGPGMDYATGGHGGLAMRHGDKRQRTSGASDNVGASPSPGTDGPGGHPPPGGGAPSSGIAMLSDVADLDLLMQENMILREELRATEGKIAMLESGVLNIKAVLTKSTDPGLVAMTGVMNLLNQLESADLVPDLAPHVRAALQGVCGEIRRHLNGVMRMVWVLRSLPEDVQRDNGGPPAPRGVSPQHANDGS